jgi:putative nucleotide binding protein
MIKPMIPASNFSRPIIKEDYAIVLDYLSNGYPLEGRRMPIGQVIGKSHLFLLEVIPKKDVNLTPLADVYIGNDKRDEIHHVSGKIPYSKLTSTARINLDSAINSIIEGNMEKWLAFFNKSGPISKRLHQLELLPGIGNKHMWSILNARQESLFKSFEDISLRVPSLPNPKELIIKRIRMELNEEDKYRLFVV